MKITQLEVIPLVRKLEQPFEGGTYRIVNRNTLVTRVYTDEGLVGEAFGGDEDMTQTEIVSLICDHFAPLLAGEDPRDAERLWSKLFFANVDLGNRGLHMLDMRNRGILTQAAAVDNALWDLRGKIYNAPLYKLLGGFRDKVPVIAIGGYYQAGKGADATVLAGVTEWRRVAALAGLFHVQMAHHEEPQVALHLLAAFPNSLYVEIFPNYERNPLWVDLPVQRPQIKDGYMHLPDGPGLGIQLNEAVIAKYRAS